MDSPVERVWGALLAGWGRGVRYDYETLCGGAATCAYQGERKNVIFMCSATRIGPNRFRLFFGGGDGNVGTGVVQVTKLPAARAGHR